ncbi:quinolinate synthase NadA [Candidatus Peregrinibacteria bacterium]|nr:quinolinate synthase NadA [Candidatus Peregrinibacteria bacterium]
MSYTKKQKDLIKEINNLKADKKAVILVHNYQKPEIYEIADFIGDSLKLCQQAAETSAKIILFCGVNFMAETAAILNPQKKVLIPYPDAGCSMADMVDADSLNKFKKKHPEAAIVCYVNSTADVKAVSDICCTSANAVNVVKSLKEKKIIFVPDKNLAAYVASQIPEKEIIAWDGYCPVHHFVNEEYLEEVKKNFPSAKIIAHPESKPEILKKSDYIASTSGMINCAKNDPAKEFFVLTECGMVERLNRSLRGKKFYGLCNLCFDMKKINLESVINSLKEEKFKVNVDRNASRKAKRAIDRMLTLT